MSSFPRSGIPCRMSKVKLFRFCCGNVGRDERSEPHRRNLPKKWWGSLRSTVEHGKSRILPMAGGRNVKEKYRPPWNIALIHGKIGAWRGCRFVATWTRRVNRHPSSSPNFQNLIP